MDAIAFEQMRQGHALMAACCALYLAWWAIFFWPKVSGGSAHGALRAIGIVAILGAVACGVFGATRICGGAAELAPTRVVVGCLVGAVVLYLVLLGITQRMFQRAEGSHTQMSASEPAASAPLRGYMPNTRAWPSESRCR